MKHKFLTQNNSLKCVEMVHGIICNRDIMAHTKLAKCEICGREAECEIYLADPKVMKCWNCEDARISAVLRPIEATAEERREINKLASEADKEGMNGLKFSGDLFNLKLPTFVELKQRVTDDDTIPVSEKEITYQRLVAKRIKELNDKIFINAEEARHLYTERLAATHALREYGGKLRDEIRNQIKQSDSTYQPIINQEAIAKSLKSKAVKSPFERAAENLALAMNINIEKAREMILKGNKE